MSRKPTYDWDYYRTRFIVSGVSYGDLANLPNSPAHDTIRERGAKEGWTAQRHAYQDALAKKTLDLTGLSHAEVAARHVRIARALQEKALERLSTLKITQLSPRAVLDYLKEATAIEREALGLDRGEANTVSELDAIADALAREPN